MERRFQVRLQQMMAEAEMVPEQWPDLFQELEEFVQPFAAMLDTPSQREHLREYLSGLLSHLGRKNAEAIAYLLDQDRQPLQRFVGQIPWEWEPLIEQLVRQVAQGLGSPNGVLVVDCSGIPKQGRSSVGAARQWCGRLGKMENCQVGVYLAYVGRKEHTLVDFRLYLPKEWSRDRRRRKQAGVPVGVRFQTRHQLALQMIEKHRQVLPHRWIAGDDEMGRNSQFRAQLRAMGEQYLLAVPCNTLIRDLEALLASRRSRSSRKPPYQRVEQWAESATEWRPIEVDLAEPGPVKMQVITRRVQTRLAARQGPEELLVIFRTLENGQAVRHDYFLSNAPPGMPLRELVRVWKASWRVEECFRRAKSEAGMDQYQVRGWIGWQQHQVLTLLACWFLVQQKLRGKWAPSGCRLFYKQYSDYEAAKAAGEMGPVWWGGKLGKAAVVGAQGGQNRRRVGWWARCAG